MLYDLAIFYFAQWDERPLIGFVWVLAGYLSAAFLYSGKTRLRRAPFFAVLGVIFLISALVQQFALFLPEAIRGDIFSLYVGFGIIVFFVTGAAFGWAARARTNDAFGRGLKANLVILPIANGLLLVAPSTANVEVPRSRYGKYSARVGLILVGVFAVFASSMIATQTRVAVLERYSDVSEDPKIVEFSTHVGLSYYGLSGFLMQTAELAEPRMFADGSALVGARVLGNTIQYISLPVNVDEASQVRQNEKIRRGHCETLSTNAVLSAGATIEVLFQDQGGNLLWKTQVQIADCDK